MEASLFDFFREVDDAAERRERRPGARPGADRSARPAIRQPTPTKRADRLRFAMKFQQYTGPVQAKGLEDTAFFRYNLLLSLNEVGSDVERFGRSRRRVPRGERAHGCATARSR